MGPELIFWILHVAGWTAGWLLLSSVCGCRPGDGRRRLPVSVVIPARNEERSLPRLLDSLKQQNPSPEEILVVDDESQDATAEIARAAGARVIPSAPLPPGWRGKAWACRQGAERAGNDTLIFMDADTWFEPGGLAAVGRAFAACGGALSLAAFQRVQRPAEELSAFFVWVMSAASGAFAFRRGAQSLFGPFLMVSRSDYRRAGGHEAVKSRVLENLWLADEFRRAGVAVRCAGGAGTLSIRMYPGGLRELAAGWKKAFASGARRTPPGRLAGIVCWLSAAAGTAVMCAAVPLSGISVGLWGALYLAFVLQIHLQLRRLGEFSFWTALLYPLALLFFFAVFAQSLFGKRVQWKGRTFAGDAAC